MPLKNKQTTQGAQNVCLLQRDKYIRGSLNKFPNKTKSYIFYIYMYKEDLALNMVDMP